MNRQVVRFDSRVGIRMLPGLQTRSRQSGAPYLMRTNTTGFRTREIAPRRRVGTRRVLFSGDSFTEGVGVSDGRRFTDILEDTLPDTEVLNFGVRATGTDQQLLFFRERPPELEYDLVVVGLYAGDVHRNHTKYGILMSATGAHFEKPYFRAERGGLVLHNVPVPVAPTDYRDLAPTERRLVHYHGVKHKLRTATRRHAPWAKAALQRMTRYQPAPYLKSATEPAWLLTVAILEQWAAEAGAPVLVVAIPPYQYVEGTAGSSAYRKRVAELGRAPALEVHDVLDDLIAARREQGASEIRIRGDAHYSAAGHRTIAESIAPVVAEILGRATQAGRGPSE